MVAWNPDVPNPNDNTPKWGRDSQPHSTVNYGSGDQTMEKLFGGLGDSLVIGAKGLDYAKKHSLDQEVRNITESERQAYTSSLEGTLAAVSPANNTSADAERRRATGMGNTPPPADIDRNIGYIESLKEGAAAGHYNDTYYKGRLVAALKDLRSNNPGYVDYIDSKVSSIVGFDPANAKISDLLTDLNKISSKKEDSESKRIGHRLEALAVEGNEEAAQKWNLFQAGKLSPQEGLAFVAKASKAKYDLQVLNTDKDTVAVNNENGKVAYSRWFDNLTSQQVSNRMNAMEDGLFKGNPKLMEAVRQHTQGIKRMDTTELGDVADILNQRVQDTREFLQAQARENNPQQQNAYKVLGPEEVNKRIEAQLKPMIDQVAHVRKGDLSAANFATRYVEARQADSTFNLIRQPILGDALTTMGSAKTLVGGENVLLKYISGIQTTNLAKPLETYINSFAIAAAKQGEEPNPRGPVTLKDQIVAVRNEAARVPVATTVKGLVDKIDTVMSAPADAKIKDSDKLGVLMSIADPKGRGILNEFERQQDRQNTYNKLTSPAFAKEAYRVTRTSPEGEGVWRNYEDMARQEWGVGLFSDYIKTMSNVTLPAGYKIGWDDGNKEFTLNDPSGKNVIYQEKVKTKILGFEYTSEKPLPTVYKPKEGAGYPELDRTLEQFAPALRQVNMGLYNIKNIAEASGKKGNDVDAYVMGFLSEAGFSPNTNNASYLPEHMIMAIKNTAARDALLKKMKENNPNELQ